MKQEPGLPEGRPDLLPCADVCAEECLGIRARVSRRASSATAAS